MEPQGLTYESNILSDDILAQIHEFIETDLQEDLYHIVSEKSRMVAHYGYSYGYKSKQTSNTTKSFPDVIQRLNENILGSKFNQCIVNRYGPGQGINKHIDSVNYGNTIACFTFLSGAEMEFTRGWDTFRLYTEPNSLYVMSGESRYDWKHQMRCRKSDPRNGKRGVRYSITFRKVLV